MPRRSLPLSEDPTFVPLPSDPSQLTAEHAAQVFGGDVDGVLRELARLVREAQQQTQQEAAS